MAYLRELTAKCKTCSSRAVVELIDRFNGSRGLYCRRCGGRALKHFERDEAVAFERAP